MNELEILKSQKEKLLNVLSDLVGSRDKEELLEMQREINKVYPPLKDKHLILNAMNALVELL